MQKLKKQELRTIIEMLIGKNFSDEVLRLTKRNLLKMKEDLGLDSTAAILFKLICMWDEA
jgi:hypothetical protein